MALSVTACGNGEGSGENSAASAQYRSPASAAKQASTSLNSTTAARLANQHWNKSTISKVAVPTAQIETPGSRSAQTLHLGADRQAAGVLAKPAEDTWMVDAGVHWVRNQALAKLPAVASAQPQGSVLNDLPRQSAVVTHHQMQLLTGEPLHYTATVGVDALAGLTSNTQILYVAYTRRNVNGKTIDRTRPITFFFSDSVRDCSIASAAYTLLESLGPKVGEPTSDGAMDLEDNPETLLDKSDLVFVHPIVSGADPDFWGKDDAKQTVERFVATYLDQNRRHDSPRFLFVHGERVVGRVIELMKTKPGIINGMAIMSPSLDPGVRTDKGWAHGDVGEEIAEVDEGIADVWKHYLKNDLGFDIANVLPGDGTGGSCRAEGDSAASVAGADQAWSVKGRAVGKLHNTRSDCLW